MRHSAAFVARGLATTRRAVAAKPASAAVVAERTWENSEKRKFDFAEFTFHALR
jgi:hypothetical protein